MSQFYGEIQGNRGEVTRGGSKNSGIRGYIRGWNNGVRVEGRYDNEVQKDVFDIYATNGSGGYDETFVGSIVDGKFIWNIDRKV